ncbi:AMP-binding protein [Xanthobacter autotrophicus]|uniref:AMP-binding protein n=1 Tax=Xanthobacter autotrophicus TaxID=280 RepID=UPI00372AA55A
MITPHMPDREPPRDYVAEGWWSNRTLFDVFDAVVARTPDKTAVVAPGGVRLSYGALAAQVNRVAGNLAAAGVGKGTVVSVQLPNCAEFVVVHLAATRLGAITNPLLPNYRAKELEYTLKFARSQVAVICGTHRGFDFAEMYLELRPKLPDLKAIYVVGGDGRNGLSGFDALLTDAPPVPETAHRGDDISALIFTSGTEAAPKGVIHSHNSMMYATAQMARVVGLTADDVVWMPSPISHGTGFTWGVRQAISLGATLVLQDIWDAEEALRLIEAERCSFVLSATPFVTMMLEAPSLAGRDTSSLRVFGCAGAPIPRQLGEQARREIGCTLIGMWGMTECFVGSASGPQESDEKLWETDGHAMPGAELAIFDSERKTILPPGEVGELATRGPHVAAGYFNDPQRTDETFRTDGWLFTNDLARMDADGYIRLVGRKKDIVNRGGLKISAREIEDLLIEHPAVEQVVLVPLPDLRLGERACACVKIRPGANVALDDLVAFLCARGVAKYKLPEFLSVVDAFPMTPSGKVQRHVLRDEILEGRILASAGPAAR